MIFTSLDKNKTIKTIRQSDLDFYIDNGITISPRAGLEIGQKCPREYKMIISECINNGWLKPIAYMKESEYVWEKLGE
jgi:hypothetical protein